MLPETRKLLALRQMRLTTPDDHIAWAVSMLEAGVESKSICILAGLSKPLYESEVEVYFQRSFREMGWSLPEPEECLRSYVHDVAENIVSSTVPPSEGCRQIYRIVKALNYPPDMGDWIQPDMGDWIQLDDELDAGLSNYRNKDELDKAIRDEAQAFIQVTDKKVKAV